MFYIWHTLLIIVFIAVAYSLGYRLGKEKTRYKKPTLTLVSDRGASIRIPMNLTQNNWKGYLEDRRPSGNADPYRVTNRILTTMES